MEQTPLLLPIPENLRNGCYTPGDAFDFIRAVPVGMSINIDTKLAFEPGVKESLTNPWTTCVATRISEDSWNLIIGEDLFAISAEDEEKSLESKNLWELKWWRFPPSKSTKGLTEADFISLECSSYVLCGFQYDLNLQGDSNGSTEYAYKSFSKVMNLDGELNLKTMDPIIVQGNSDELHIFCFAAAPLTNGVVSNDVEAHKAVLYNLDTKETQFASLTAVKKYQHDLSFDVASFKNGMKLFLDKPCYKTFETRLSREQSFLPKENSVDRVDIESVLDSSNNSDYDTVDIDTEEGISKENGLEKPKRSRKPANKYTPTKPSPKFLQERKKKRNKQKPSKNVKRQIQFSSLPPAKMRRGPGAEKGMDPNRSHHAHAPEKGVHAPAKGIHAADEVVPGPAPMPPSAPYPFHYAPPPIHSPNFCPPLHQFPAQFSVYGSQAQNVPPVSFPFPTMLPPAGQGQFWPPAYGHPGQSPALNAVPTTPQNPPGWNPLALQMMPITPGLQFSQCLQTPFLLPQGTPMPQQQDSEACKVMKLLLALHVVKN